jgi:putative transposase
MTARKHLKRLERVWTDWPIYFITTCTRERGPILASAKIANILEEEWRGARDRHGWTVGRYVIMPDHVHFFCSAELESKTLQVFMRRWKEWSSKRAKRELGFHEDLWQEEFFDHVLRSRESYREKWDYVRQNPVRARLIANADDWPWQGEIELLIV